MPQVYIHQTEDEVVVLRDTEVSGEDTFMVNMRCAFVISGQDISCAYK